ncbi:MAG: GIY-YIG nuclease family protein [Ilumatobacter sp.]|nr:GIY-YIG nuclease family protein [Ilumatobacter sp.]
MTGLINAYGLHWHRDHVNWGKGRVARTMMGVPAKARRNDPVDVSGRAAIYALYGPNFDLVYVGQAGAGASTNLGSRLAAHRRDHLAQRWERFSWFALAPGRKAIPHGTALNQLEAVLMAVSEPRLNLQRGRFGAGVEQLLQQVSTTPEGG